MPYINAPKTNTNIQQIKNTVLILGQKKKKKKMKRNEKAKIIKKSSYITKNKNIENKKMYAQNVNKNMNDE